MKKITFVVDLLLDETDLDRVRNSPAPYLYTADSNSLYPKHITHLDYHHPNLAISYGKDNHKIIDLEKGRWQDFVISHRGLDRQFSVAMGVTDHLAMLAVGDTEHTQIQVIDVDQPLKVFLDETYRDDQSTSFYPLPRYFTGTPEEAVLVFSDNSRLPVDLVEFTLGSRQQSEVDRIIRSKTVVSPYLSIFGPFILLTISPDMSKDELYSVRLLVEQASTSDWYVVDDQTLVNIDLAEAADVTGFDTIISQRQAELRRVQEFLDEIEQ